MTGIKPRGSRLNSTNMHIVYLSIEIFSYIHIYLLSFMIHLEPKCKIPLFTKKKNCCRVVHNRDVHNFI